MRPTEVHITFPSEDGAISFARELLHRRLGACIQIIPVRSIYRWKDVIEEEPEQLLMIKTDESAIPDIERMVKELHPYELPEFWVVPGIVRSGEYLEWLDNCLKDDGGRRVPHP